MKKEMLMSLEANEKRVAILENGKLEEFYIERAEAQKMFGNIYSRKEISMMRRRMALSLNVMSGEKKNLARDFDVLNEMRESVFDFVMSNKYSKQRSEFRAIITDTSKKLRKLLGKNEKHN